MRDLKPANRVDPLGATEGDRRPLSRRERLVAGAIFSGLAVVLAIGLAVIVAPSLFDVFRPVWPLLAVIGLASTAGGFWVLYRP